MRNFFVHQGSRIINGIMLLAVFFSAFGGNNFPAAKAKEVNVNTIPCLFNSTFNVGHTGRILILLQGLGTKNDSVQDFVWEKLTDPIRHLYDGFVYFSYNGNDPLIYQASDTAQSLWSHHIPLLAQLVESCSADNPNSTIDLIGHSQGGVIANEYIKMYGLKADSAAQKVRHVLTLDSPINGSLVLHCINIDKKSWNFCRGWLPNTLSFIFQKWANLTDSGYDLGHRSQVKGNKKVSRWT